MRAGGHLLQWASLAGVDFRPRGNLLHPAATLLWRLNHGAGAL